eukprot:TRINITY_DN755_c0_g1_i1.p1 TRINITY_DN755_c0_g1~~TRINITY_DN755_c0_g1_i1.p1  ORF type:complete len:146 (+),score=47.19 TRINITY_DN755_c0_g1_i1:64-501(+)
MGGQQSSPEPTTEKAPSTSSEPKKEEVKPKEETKPKEGTKPKEETKEKPKEEAKPKEDTTEKPKEETKEKSKDEIVVDEQKQLTNVMFGDVGEGKTLHGNQQMVTATMLQDDNSKKQFPATYNPPQPKNDKNTQTKPAMTIQQPI